MMIEKMMSWLKGLLLAGVGSSVTIVMMSASALATTSVFQIPHFVEQGKFAVGLEPAVTLSQDAGVGFNVKYSHGVSHLSNFLVGIGTSNAQKRFRAGAGMTFDVFPDVEGQPGIGVAGQGYYYRLRTGQVSEDQVELTAVPYIHESFQVDKTSEVEPYVSFPVGLSFNEGRYEGLSTAALGALFQTVENLRYNVEVGVAVNNTQSYVSGGVIYYY